MCYYFPTQLPCELVLKEELQLLPESAKVMISAVAISSVMDFIPVPNKWTTIEHTSDQYIVTWMARAFLGNGLVNTRDTRSQQWNNEVMQPASRQRRCKRISGQAQ
jgi:hypothetical protein